MKKGRLISYSTYFIFLFLWGCSGVAENMDRLVLDSIVLDGQSVSFDNDEDFYIHRYNTGKESVRIQVGVRVSSENKSDMAVTLYHGNRIIPNDSKQVLSKNINAFRVKIFNHTDSRDFYIYISKGYLSEVLIEDNLIDEVRNNKGEINKKIKFEIKEIDFAGSMIFSGAIGEDIIATKKVTINNISTVDGISYRSYESLRSDEITPFTAKLIKISDTELSFEIRGKVKENGHRDSSAFIDISFSKSAFITPTDEKYAYYAFQKNDYLLKVDFGDVFLVYDRGNVNITSDGKVTEKINFTLYNTTFLEVGTVSTNDYEYINNPYGLDVKITVDSTKKKGFIELEGRAIRREVGNIPLIIKWDEDPFKDISDRSDITGSVRSIYLRHYP